LSNSDGRQATSDRPLSTSDGRQATFAMPLATLDRRLATFAMPLATLDRRLATFAKPSADEAYRSSSALKAASGSNPSRAPTSLPVTFATRALAASTMGPRAASGAMRSVSTRSPRSA
jgi:uncharacterized membrane protein